MKFAMSYSGGKDSALALYRLLQQNHQCVALISTANSEQQRTWFHGIPNELMQAAADSMQIPLIMVNSTADNYTEALAVALLEAKGNGAEACAFGDIDIEDHKTWDSALCESVGLQCLLPLWQEDRNALVNELLMIGFKPLVKIVDLSSLDESLLGLTLTSELVQKIIAAGADACGENGEYHTFVYDGPSFSKPVDFSVGEVIDLVTHKAIDIFLPE